MYLFISKSNGQREKALLCPPSFPNKKTAFCPKEGWELGKAALSQ